MQMSSSTVIAGQSIKDNRYHSEAGIIKTTISQEKQESLAESYSYENTESSSHEVGVR